MENPTWDIVLPTLLDPLRAFIGQEYSPIQPGDHTLARPGPAAEAVQKLENSFFGSVPMPEPITKAYELLGYPQNTTGVEPAISIFSALSLSGAKAKKSRFYSPDPLDSLESNSAFPAEVPNGNLEKVLLPFRTDFKEALRTAPNPETFFRMCMRMMERYTWCLSFSGGLSGVSLYDYARLLSAVAACLAQTPREKDPVPSFVLLSADFSGIQKFIFSGNGLHSGAAKRLRARSFLVSSVMHLVQHILLKELSLPPSCTLMDSGGNLYMLLPNTAEADSKCSAVCRLIDAEIFKKFHGSVSIHMVTTKITAEDFAKFGQVMRKARAALQKVKHQAFHARLTKDGVWDTADPFPISGDRENGLCAGCGRVFAEKPPDPQNEDSALCSECLEEQKIGWKLTKATAISLVPGTDGLMSLGGWSLEFVEQDTVEQDNEVFALTSHDEKTRLLPVMRVSNYVSADESGKIMTFDHLEEQPEKGIQKLAVLKADVDSMGALFSYGFTEEKEPDRVSVFQITALSRMLEYFFCDYLASMMKKEYSLCYTVFSGGDDLLMIGHWQDIIGLAMKIQKDFTEYCAGNGDLTLSAGVSMFSHKTPVTFAVEEAERALEAAKEKGDQNEGGRNQISLLGREMKWSRAHEVLSLAEKIAGW